MALDLISENFLIIETHRPQRNENKILSYSFLKVNGVVDQMDLRTPREQLHG